MSAARHTPRFANTEILDGFSTGDRLIVFADRFFSTCQEVPQCNKKIVATNFRQIVLIPFFTGSEARFREAHSAPRAQIIQSATLNFKLVPNNPRPVYLRIRQQRGPMAEDSVDGGLQDSVDGGLRDSLSTRLQGMEFEELLGELRKVLLEIYAFEKLNQPAYLCTTYRDALLQTIKQNFDMTIEWEIKEK